VEGYVERLDDRAAGDQQRRAIMRWRPWERSTGPRTTEGKARSARNADKGGQWRAWREMMKALNAGIRAQRESLERLTERRAGRRSRG
jgi:hypothetical protein